MTDDGEDCFELEAKNVVVDEKNAVGHDLESTIKGDAVVAADMIFMHEQDVNEVLSYTDFALKKIEENPPQEDLEHYTGIPIPLNEEALQSIRSLYESNADPFEIFRVIAPEAADDIFSPYKKGDRPRPAG